MSETRLAGLLYLAVIAAGFFANGIVHGGAPRTVLGAETLFRAGLAAQIAMYACYGGVSAIFYRLFGQSSLCLLAACVSLSGISIGAANVLTDTAALALLGENEALAQALLRLHGVGFGIALAFFGFYLMALGTLILASRIVPRVLGAFLVLEGLCFAGFELVHFVAPAAALPWNLLLATSLAEVSLALWLLVR
jgi:Domain of unknown function (DUF4386)